MNSNVYLLQDIPIDKFTGQPKYNIMGARKYGEIKILASDYFDIIPRRENVITTTDVNGKEEVIL